MRPTNYSEKQLKSSCFCILSHEGVLSILGEDAKVFLQGQLTCNINYLHQGKSSLGARCTHKGRMQSTFRILVNEDKGFLISMASDLLESQSTSMGKYAVFSKVKISYESSRWFRIGLYRATRVLNYLGLKIPEELNSVVSTRGILSVRVSFNRIELWIPSVQEYNSTLSKIKNYLSEMDTNQWLLMEVREGIAHIREETTERYIPQMINLPSLGGVSFKKGCYIGQEVIARSQFKGKIKRALYHLVDPSKKRITPGTSLFSTENKSIGEVVVAVSNKETTELLAVMRNDAMREQGIKLLVNNLVIDFNVLSLPYNVNPDEDIQK